LNFTHIGENLHVPIISKTSVRRGGFLSENFSKKCYGRKNRRAEKKRQQTFTALMGRSQ
jgi:hypothetical protein